ncbi:MAG: hypothetical protein QXZ17_01715 [Nitrososphaerota archaeon]
MSEYLKRHSISLNITQGIVKQLANRDEEFSSQLYNLRKIYKADNDVRIFLFPRLIKITRKEVKD